MTLLIKKLINKKQINKKLIEQYILYRHWFPTKLGLVSIFTSWDLKNRISRPKLRIQSYSQVETQESRPKYLKIHVLIGFCSRPVFYLNWFIGLRPLQGINEANEGLLKIVYKL